MAEIAYTKHHSRMARIKRVLVIVLFLNLAVALAKYGYGSIMQSAAMRADGIHSFFDSVGNVVGLIGISMAARPADSGHPYGHHKFETYASLFIGALLILAAVEVGSSAITDIISHESSTHVTVASYGVMIATLIVNISVTIYEHHCAKKLGSEILSADASHTLSDVLVSLGVIVGFILVQLGFPLADPIMALIVMCMILYTAFDVFKTASFTLADHARVPEDEVKQLIESIDGIRNTHRIRSRGTQEEVFLDLHIIVEPEMTVKEAHDLCDGVEELVKKDYPSVKDVTIHVEPDERDQCSRNN